MRFGAVALQVGQGTAGGRGLQATTIYCAALTMMRVSCQLMSLSPPWLPCIDRTQDNGTQYRTVPVPVN